MQKLNRVVTDFIEQYGRDRIVHDLHANIAIANALGDISIIMTQSDSEAPRVTSEYNPVTGLIDCTASLQLPKLDVEPLYHRLSRHLSPEQIDTEVTSFERLMQLLKMCNEKDQLLESQTH